MSSSFVQRGALSLAMALVLALLLTAAFSYALPRADGASRREGRTQEALARAREALIAYAAARPVDEVVGPGYLPCPDLDDDGWAEPTCGSLSGDSGQDRRLGRLPWKTLGLPDLRDADGERLWYAVSSKHKGLLNCAASPGCLDMSPESALGTITVRDASGQVLHDGTSTNRHAPALGGAVAVLIAPGAPLRRWGGAMQRRSCEGGQCDATGRCLTEPPMRTPRCAPENYLDRAPGPAFADEDNARFVDRNDAAGRALNVDGFIQGPLADAQGTVRVNDRLLAVTYDDLMPPVMRRVAEEVSACLRAYGDQAGHGGRTPWPAPLCRAADADPARRWADGARVRFGRIADTPFLATRESGSGVLSTRWPASPGACSLASAEGDTASVARFTWWSAWKRHVFYAVAGPARPDAVATDCDSISCLVTSPDGGPGHRFAVLVAGHPLQWDGRLQARDAAADADARQWLEADNADLRRLNANPPTPDCPVDPGLPTGPGNAGANRLALDRHQGLNDVVVATR